MSLHKRQKRGNLLNLRLAILGACCGWFAQKYLKSYYFPHGLPAKQEWDDRPICAPIDETNEKLTLKSGKLQKIYERIDEDAGPLLKSAETVFFDEGGIMYFANENGNLITMTDFQTDETGKTTAKTTFVRDLGPGRPLSGKFSGDTLYMADAVLGLTRIQNVSDSTSKVEIVASSVVDNGKRSPLLYVDDIAIGPKSGAVYFTDASVVAPDRDIQSLTYDVMHASKIDSLLGPTGRLIKYDPSTDEVTVLARDIWFANGVAVDSEEDFVLFAETFRLGLLKYHLKGNKEGTTEYIVKGNPSPGYFDGVDCSIAGRTAESSLCYAVNPCACVPAHKLLWRLPHPVDVILKSLVMLIPPSLAPKTVPFGGVLIFDPKSSKLIELLQDPKGEDIGLLTGVTIENNKLYLASLHNTFVGVYDLSA